MYTLLAVAGCTSSPGKDFFTETIDSLHAKNSPLRAGYAGPATVTSAQSAAQRFNGAQYQGVGPFVRAEQSLSARQITAICKGAAKAGFVAEI
ncbi:hypothetical protein X742_22270 [Mesorhizobium sp. LNHC232B00]|nr:hypothetical protein X742_22270 [Mesorhizobium sp. LNHC232B00]